ncbi:MAG: hypothetical protein AABX03_02975 [Nanoarchaeota archaeon]
MAPKINNFLVFFSNGKFLLNVKYMLIKHNFKMLRSWLRVVHFSVSINPKKNPLSLDFKIEYLDSAQEFHS